MTSASGRANRPAPATTYRLQITADFDLFEATRVLPYLHELGVDWVYLSPLLAAEPGSPHGYDVVGFDRVDQSRGGAAGLEALSAEVRRLGMGVLVDIVPNHAGVATPHENAWWWDVLRHGRTSRHAPAFDIDWDFGNDRVRIPVLADEDVPAGDGPIGDLEIGHGPEGEPELHYRGQRFPVAPGTADDMGADGVDATGVLARQHYELVGWRRADDELNYRRFFAVNTLAAVRVEDSSVFADTHAEIGRWFDQGLVDGLRVDHPDGLRDPRGYLDDLADRAGHPYVLVEKILALRKAQGPAVEELPHDWTTAGTTGYDVLALVDRVLVDPDGEAPLTDLETRLRGERIDWADEVHDRKLEVATGILRSETRRIVRELPDLAPSAEQLEEAVAELLACFPVYRSYLPEGRDHLDEALRRARARRGDLGDALAALAPVLGDPGAAAALRFQQTSGMVMAKGAEDCAFYRTGGLTSLAEVGGDPATFALTPAEFHAAMAARQQRWPRAMTTLSTHDTKRGEDVRARISVLAEMPLEWEASLEVLLQRAPQPDRVFGSLLWQAILGAWPCGVFGNMPADLRSRLHAYAEKAMRESGQHTSWTDPDADHEQAVHAAVDTAFDDAVARSTLAGLLDRVVRHGWSNALVAKLVAITAPGVCDVYQGSELWEQSLVDPDNRRPVDFERRAASLETLDNGRPPPRPTGPDDSGAAKLWVVRNGLRLRRDRPELFAGYAPMHASGAAAGHLLAFDRGGAVTVGTRLPAGLERRGGWGGTSISLPPGRWRDLLAPTGETFEGDVQVGRLLGHLPVALLVQDGGG